MLAQLPDEQARAQLAAPAGDVSLQRGIEATDKLVSLLISFVCILLGFQAIGLDVQSVLAISGFGGLALGLAGREILENLFNGLLIISSRSFEIGEEIMFTQARSGSAASRHGLRVAVQPWHARMCYPLKLLHGSRACRKSLTATA